MIFVEITILLAAIFLGIRLGGLAIGFTGGLGVIGLILCGLKIGNIPWETIFIIMTVISAISAMQEAGGIDYLVQLASKILNKNPKLINFLAPAVTWLLTVFAGSSYTVFSIIPVITEVAKRQNIRPCVPLSIAVISSQIAITASPVSAAVVFMASDLALGGLGFGYTDLLLIWIPTTFAGCMLTAFVMNIFCDMDLSNDPNYIKRLEKGLVKKVRPLPTTTLKPHAKRSVLIFLMGLIGVFFFVSVDTHKSSFNQHTESAAYEKVYENKKSELSSKINIEPLIEIKNSNTNTYSNTLQKFDLSLSRNNTIISLMMLIAILIVITCKVNVNNITATNTFKNGMTACVCVLGVAWLGNTFVSNHTAKIQEMAINFVLAYPPILVLGLFLASMLLYSQAGTAKALIPSIITALDMTATNNGDAYILVASFAATSALFVIPTYPTLLGAVQMDDTGTTYIGKYIFNHPFMVPGILAISFTVALGFVFSPVML
jgi:anaerobic C4-dicarboxylate transporter DcuA